MPSNHAMTHAQNRPAAGSDDPVPPLLPSDPALPEAPQTLSFTSSSCLMQDALPGDALPAGDGTGPNQVAPFANPYLKAKEEALFIDSDGELSYLHRTFSQTGWGQEKVLDANGAPIPVREVVTIVDGVDLAVRAVFTGSDYMPRTLTLTLRADTEASDNPVCRWVPGHLVGTPGFSPPLKLMPVSNLCVDYDSHRASVYGISGTGAVITFRSAIRTPGPGMVMGAWDTDLRLIPVGPSDGLAVLRTKDGYAGVQYRAEKNTVAYQDLNGGYRTDSGIASLVGAFHVYDKQTAGYLCLNAAGDLLVRWVLNSNGAATTWGEDTVAGFGFTKAYLWTDADGMLHVYGRDRDNTLQVLHQDSWSVTGGPVWAHAVVQPNPGPHGRGRGGHAHGGHVHRGRGAYAHDLDPSVTTTTVCVGLHTGVIDFAIDPYPDYLPSQFVKMEGVAASDKYCFLSQDPASTRWAEEKVRLPSVKTKAPHVVSHYVSEVTLLTGSGTPAVGSMVSVGADALVEIVCNGASYLIGPGHSAALPVDGAGRITVAMPANSLLPPTLQIAALGAEANLTVQPATDVHNFLAGKSTLGSQTGRFDGTALLHAKDEDGNRIAPDLDQKSADGLAGHITGAIKTGQGEPVVSWLHTGPGSAPLLHSFAIRKEADGTLTSFNFTLEEEDKANAYLADIRSQPEYGGILDGFFQLLSDCWEGIKNGAIEVTNAFVAVGTKMLHVVMKIAGKTIELIEEMVEGVRSAVHAVEAVFRMAVEAVTKVVDWLKALFAFQDIWDTKTALEHGAALMLDYGVGAFHHFGSTAHDWFKDREADVTTTFAGLRTHFGASRAGDLQNASPALMDASGGGVDKQALPRNPQATWMLNQVGCQATVNPGSLRFLSSAEGSPISDALESFFDSVAASGLDDVFAPVKNALFALLNPADPNGANSVGVVALLDLLEQAAIAFLRLADPLVQAAVTALVTLFTAVMAELRSTNHDFGFLGTLYKWVQTAGGLENPEEPTFLGMFSLVAAFFLTTVYKLVQGVDQAPFPGGLFPVFGRPPWHPASGEAGGQAGGEVGIDPDPRDMIILQITANTLGMLAGLTDILCDVSALDEYFEHSWLPMLTGVNVFSNVFAFVVGNTPSVVGVAWDAEGGLWAGTWAVTTAYTLIQIGTVITFLVDTNKTVVDSPVLKNVGAGLIGPIISFVFNATCVGLSSAAVSKANAREPVSPYTAAATIMQFIPGVLPIFRIKFKKWAPEDPTLPYRVIAVCVLDALLAMSSAVMGLIASIDELNNPPVVLPGQSPVVQAGAQSTYQVVATGGRQVWNTPLKEWEVEFEPEDGTVAIDADGLITATFEKKGGSHEVEVKVTCRDSYIPSRKSEAGTVTFIVNT